jgi:hypothetical protein
VRYDHKKIGAFTGPRSDGPDRPDTLYLSEPGVHARVVPDWASAHDRTLPILVLVKAKVLSPSTW